MNLHEYQSKARFEEFGIPIPHGQVAERPHEARRIAQEIGGPVVVKAQVLTGGRGKAGGVRLARTPEEAEQHAQAILGMDIRGHTVCRVLVEPAADIRQEIYLVITNDRTARAPVIMCSAEGGMDIEEVNRVKPEAIIRLHIDPMLGLRSYQVNALASGIELPYALWQQFQQIAMGLYRCYVESDATLCEINPLIITQDDRLLAVDGKMSLDDNALFRHPDLAAQRDTSAEPPEETQARQAGLSYVKLSGQIGCMVNGAGLAMATMDMTSLYGAAEGIGPANFLDIGGGADADTVAAALRIILADPNVKVILLNIFGGITRADEVARGVIAAFAEFETDIPKVVRLVGTNEEEGRALLESANIPNMITATTLSEAARRAVAAVKGA